MNVSYYLSHFAFCCIILLFVACQSEKSKVPSEEPKVEIQDNLPVEPAAKTTIEEGSEAVKDNIEDEPGIVAELEKKQGEVKEVVAPEKPTKKTVKKKPKKVKKYAKMTFDSVIHRLPDVVEGDNFKNAFVFENTGEVPLTIQGASSSCGCTTPNYSFLDIEPGEKSSIGVDYFSVNKDGPQVAEIVIKANTFPAETTLKMLFNVLPQEKDQKTKTDSLPN